MSLYLFHSEEWNERPKKEEKNIIMETNLFFTEVLCEQTHHWVKLMTAMKSNNINDIYKP